LAKIVFVLIFTILISASFQFPAFAAELTRSPSKMDPSGGLSISATVGGYSFAGSEQRNITPSYGVKVGYEKIKKSIADNLGIEGTLNYFSSRSNATALNNAGYLLRLDATYPFLIKKTWMPYIVVGVGEIIIDGPANTNSNFLFNYGVGVKYFLENYLAVRADVRQLVVYEGSDIRNNYEIGVGVSYYFGKERPKKPTPLPVPEKKKIEVLEDVPVKTEEVAKPDAVDNAVTAVTATPSAIPIVKEEVVKKVSIEFDKNSSAVKPEYLKQLKEVADILIASGDVTALIDGHADISGKLPTNIALSEQRAQSVQSSLIKSGVNPKQLSITAHGPLKPIADNATVAGRQKNRRAEIQVIKTSSETKIATEQELQLEADRIENVRLAAELLAKSRIKAAVLFQEVSGALPVGSSSSLSFDIVNQGFNTEEYMVTLTAPKEFDALLTRAKIPDEKVTLLRLAPGEKFKGSVLFRIPAGMDDGQKAAISVKVVSTKYSDVFFQKESLVTSSAPLVRVVTKLSRKEVAPGEKLRYQLTLLNAGSLPARNLTIKLQLPPQVDLFGTPDVPFTQDAGGMIVFKVNSIESGKSAEISLDLKVSEGSASGQELLWNVEVIDGTLQRRSKSTERASVVRSK
jgi:outer membrane beta-barrel protein